LEQSLAIGEEVGNKWGIADCLLNFGCLHDIENRPEQAVPLWVVGQRLRDESSSPLNSRQREMYDRYMSAARQSLGDEAFATARAAGQAMSCEQAIEYALAETQ
jgi:hypothetical protein